MTSKKTVDTVTVKALSPRDADVKYMGEEPSFSIEVQDRNVLIARAFNWYNHFFTKKDAKQMLIQYLEINNDKNAKIFGKVEESSIVPTYCYLARMCLRGLILTEKEKNNLNAEIQRLCDTVKKDVTESVVVENKVNIQDLMRERARELGGELEGMFDDFLRDGAKSNHSFKPIDEMAKMNVLPQHMSFLVDVWKQKYNEFQEVLQGKDDQLIEGYSHLSKTQIKNIVKFIELVIGDINGYINVKKANKKPRARKSVPVEKIVNKVKFLKKFVDATEKLEIVSLSPTKLVGASECYLYDTVKRKLVYFVADEYSKTLTVKGTTILGFDNKLSQSKTIRKPGVQLNEFMKLGKPGGRKFFDSIKAAGTEPSGRTNENMLILKAW